MTEIPGVKVAPSMTPNDVVVWSDWKSNLIKFAFDQPEYVPDDRSLSFDTRSNLLKNDVRLMLCSPTDHVFSR